jgi:hypothetical protein
MKVRRRAMGSEFYQGGCIYTSGNYWLIPTFEDESFRPDIEYSNCPYKWIDIEIMGWRRRNLLREGL